MDRKMADFYFTINQSSKMLDVTIEGSCLKLVNSSKKMSLDSSLKCSATKTEVFSSIHKVQYISRPNL